MPPKISRVTTGPSSFRTYWTLSEMIQMFTDREFTITDYTEADVDPPYDAHCVKFDGDYNEAMRLVSVAIACELRLHSLRQTWTFESNEMNKPKWQIMIYNTEEDDDDLYDDCCDSD